MSPKHPLQRLASPSPHLSLLVHLVGLIAFSLSFRSLSSFPAPLAAHAFGSYWQFLTIIGLTLSHAVFSLALLADLIHNPGLFAAKNALAVVAAPLGVLISLLYWGLCALDRQLVMPDGFGLPWLVDVGFHAAPAGLLVFDCVVLSPPWRIGWGGAGKMSVGLAAAYWAWVEYCFRQNGWYPYPIFALLTVPQRALLVGVSAGLMATSTIALKWLYGKINGVDEAKKGAHAARSVKRE